MSRTHTSTLALGAVVVALLALPASALADAKPIGLVDSQRIVKEYGAARDAQEQVQKYVKDLEKEIGEKERALQRFMEDLESQKMLLGEAALQAKQQEFQKMRDDYLTFREQAEQKADAEYKTRIGPIIDQVRTIAERIGKEEGFGIIVDSASLTTLYVDSSVDLTDKVLAALVTGQ
jgi:Skp family chaperone for outer membrane proteins